MYFPYMRGKRHELLALRTLAPTISGGGNVIPVLEPVNPSALELQRAAKDFADHEMPFIVLFNPLVGKLSRSGAALGEFQETVFPSLLDQGATPGLLINHDTPHGFIEVFLRQHIAQEIAFVHLGGATDIKKIAPKINSHSKGALHLFFESKCSHHYRELFHDGYSVLLQDSFNKQRRNADYPPDEFFSDIHLNYKKDGYYGFGDFLTLGAHYDESGGLAHTVTIHLTYENEDGEIWVRHFLSDTQTIPPNDPAMKYREALKKLYSFLQENPKIVKYSRAAQSFISDHKNKEFHGLGKIKELSMQHHLELMQQMF